MYRLSAHSNCIPSLQEIQQLLIYIKYAEIYKHLGATPPQGFLLHGPPGCGKTLMAHAIAGVSRYTCSLGFQYITAAVMTHSLRTPRVSVGTRTAVLQVGSDRAGVRCLWRVRRESEKFVQSGSCE